MGVEVIAVTAGEASNPSQTIPRAMRTMVFRLVVFYVLAIGVMLAMTPWNQTQPTSGLTGSPFVHALGAVHIPYSASIMNLVVITAALSSANTNLYLTTRMLFSLSRGHYAPAWLGRLSANGVPRRALGIATAGMIAAILLAIFAPSRAFLMLYGVGVAGMFFVWIVILLTHLGFRRKLGATRVARLPIRVAFFPYSTIVGIVALFAIAGSTFFVDGLRLTVPAFVPLLVAMTVAYWLARRKSAPPDDEGGYQAEVAAGTNSAV
jgi:AAT family amino acid transporter